MGDYKFWLVVDLPLWNIWVRQLGWLMVIPNLWKVIITNHKLGINIIKLWLFQLNHQRFPNIWKIIINENQTTKPPNHQTTTKPPPNHQTMINEFFPLINNYKHMIYGKNNPNVPNHQPEMDIPSVKREIAGKSRRVYNSPKSSPNRRFVGDLSSKYLEKNQWTKLELTNKNQKFIKL